MVTEPASTETLDRSVHGSNQLPGRSPRTSALRRVRRDDHLMHGHLGGGGDVHGSEGLDRVDLPSGPGPCPAAEGFPAWSSSRCAERRFRGGPTRDSNAGGLRVLGLAVALGTCRRGHKQNYESRSTPACALLSHSSLTWSRTGVRAAGLSRRTRCTASCVRGRATVQPDQSSASRQALDIQHACGNNGRRPNCELSKPTSVANPRACSEVLGVATARASRLSTGSGRGDSGFFVSSTSSCSVGLRAGR